MAKIRKISFLVAFLLCMAGSILDSSEASPVMQTANKNVKLGSHDEIIIKVFENKESRKNQEEKPVAKSVKTKKYKKSTTPFFSTGSISDYRLLLERLKTREKPYEKRIWKLLDRDCKKKIEGWTPGMPIDDSTKKSVIYGFNRILKMKNFCKNKVFNNKKVDKSAIVYLNRILFETIFPGIIVKSEKDEGELQVDCQTVSKVNKKVPKLVIQYCFTSDRYFVTISEDGKYVATYGLDHKIKIWDVKTGDLLLTIDGKQHEMGIVFFSKDNRFIISRYTSFTDQIWDLETGKKATESSFSSFEGAKSYKHNNYQVNNYTKQNIEKIIKFNFDGKKKIVRVFEKSKPGWVNRVKFMPDSNTIISKVFYGASRQCAIYYWDINNVSTIGLKKQASFGESFVISPDSNFIASKLDSDEITVWNLKTKKTVRKLDKKYALIPSRHYSQDLKYLVYRGGLYEAKSVIPGSGLMGMKVVDLKKIKQKLKLYDDLSSRIKEFSFSPVNNQLAIGRESNVEIIDADKGKIIKTLEGHKLYVVSVAFSPDGSKIASGSFDSTIKIWDVKTGKCLRTLKGHDYFVKSVDYSPDGRFLLSGSWDSTMKLWNPKTGKLLATMINFYDGNWIAYTPEGFFDGSKGGMEKIGWTLGMTFYSFKLCKNGFQIPGLMAKIFKGEKIPKTPDLRKNFPEPPKVTIESVICRYQKKNNKNKFTYEITVKANENDGGFRDLKLYNNGKECRGNRVKANNSKPENIHRKIFTVKMIPGKNKIKAVSFNRNKTIESKPCKMEIDFYIDNHGVPVHNVE